MARFSDRMVPEMVQVFWTAMARGEFVTAAAAEAGTYREKGTRWLIAESGIRPRRGRNLKGRCLTFAEREEIAVARAGGESMRIDRQAAGAQPLDDQPRAGAQRRSWCWVSRDDARTRWRMSAPADPSRPSCRPTSSCATRWRKISAGATPPSRSTGGCAANSLKMPEMRVSPETIYQSLYVQSRGALRRDLTKCLRTGRALRRPGRQAGKRRNQIPDMINITERPAEADDRAVPGHWEGDLIIGKNNRHRDRDAGGAHHRLHDAGAPPRRLQEPSKSATR